MTYTNMTDSELMGIINAASDLRNIEPCVRVLCDRHGVSYDGWDYAMDCYCIYDLLVSRMQMEGSNDGGQHENQI